MSNEHKQLVDTLLSEKSIYLQISTFAISLSDFEAIVKIIFYIVSILSVFAYVYKMRLESKKTILETNKLKHEQELLERIERSKNIETKDGSGE